MLRSLSLLCLSLCLTLTLAKIPKRFSKTKGDRTLYCSVCEMIFTDAETTLLEEPQLVWDDLGGHRIDSNGKKMRKRATQRYHEHIVLDAIENICPQWTRQFFFFFQPPFFVPRLPFFRVPFSAPKQRCTPSPSRTNKKSTKHSSCLLQSL